MNNFNGIYEYKQASAQASATSGATAEPGRAAPLGITTILGAIPKPRGLQPYVGEAVSSETGEILQYTSDQNHNCRLKFDHDAFRVRKYALQSVARSILPPSFKHDGKTKNFRVRNCLRAPIKKTEKVDIYKSNTSMKCHYGALQVCASVWTCPVCASKITERKSQIVGNVVDSHMKLGKPVYLVTFTFPHGIEDDLKTLLTKFKAASNGFHKSRKIKEFKDKRGFIESIKSLEITFSNNNGWHPHQHELWFFDSFVSARRIKNAIFDQWKNYCIKRGLKAPNFEFGIDVRRGSKASDYITKMGWNISREVSKGHTKKSTSSYAPFDLLDLYLNENKSFAKKRFIEYAKYTFGMQYISRFPKLQKLYNVADKSDEEAANALEDSAQLLGSLTLEQWRLVLKNEQRLNVLMLAEKHGMSTVFKFIEILKKWKNCKNSPPPKETLFLSQ